MQLEPAVSTLSVGSLHGLLTYYHQWTFNGQTRSLSDAGHSSDCVTRDCVSRIWTRAALAVAVAATDLCQQYPCPTSKPIQQTRSGYCLLQSVFCCMDVMYSFYSPKW